jgi:nitrite reductase/ring-hydroxylating ferredoxin subunit
MENIKISGSSRSEPVIKNFLLITRRELVARCIQFFAVGGLFSLIWKFVQSNAPSDLLVSFHHKPQKGEVVYDQGVYLVGLEHGVKAFSERCPHLGCQLFYDEQSFHFQCPCHGSRFSLEGLRVEGPAQKNMFGLELLVDNKCGTYTTKLPIF